jgi:hypothetical protein
LLCGVVDDILIRGALKHLLEFGDSIVGRDLLTLFLIEKRLDIKTRQRLDEFTAAFTSTFDFRGY